MIRDGELRYLVVCSYMARGREEPSKYFAKITGKRNWHMTKVSSSLRARERSALNGRKSGL